MNKKSELIKIVKYIFSSGSSFLLDLIIFTIINNLLKNKFSNESIIIATIISRILSSLYNYFLNSRMVFKKYDKTSIIKYYILVAVQMVISAVSVYLLSNIFIITSTAIKFIIDIVIFAVNYIIQRRFIFK